MISRRNALLRATAWAAAATALLGGASAALAQGSEAWPTRTVKLIVPYAAGGYADTRARLIADSLGKVLGQPVIIDNRGGAGGVTGTDAIAKAKPGDLTYGSSGVGGAHHLSGELLAYQTQTQLTHVPYKGGSLAATDLMGGHLAMMFEMGYSALPSIKAKKINALAVSSKTRLAVLPEVPTLDEAGVKGFESYNWLGMIAPAGTPDAVVAKLNQAVNEALKNDKSLRQMIESSGGQIMGGTPQAYGKYLEAERAKWGPVIKNANISLD